MTRREWREAFRRLEARRANIERWVREALRLGGRVTAALRDVRSWRDRHGHTSLTLGEHVVALLIPGLLIGIACGDFMLARPTAVWLATMFGEPQWQRQLVWLLPVTLFLLDLLVAVLIEKDRRRAADGESHPQTTALVVGVLLIALPSLSLATQLAVIPATHLAMFWLRTIALVALSFLLHGVVIFGGRLVIESIDSYAYAIGHLVLTRRLASYRRGYDRAVAQAHAEHAIYHRLWCEFGDEGKRLTYGPFSREVATLLGLDLSAVTQAGDETDHDETVNGTELVPRSADTPDAVDDETVRH